MANYIVKLPRKEEIVIAEEKRHREKFPNCYPSPTCWSVEVNIDLFILAILDCETAGIDIRKTMDKLINRAPWQRKIINAPLIVGRIFWASDKRLIKRKISKELSEMKVTDAALRDIGEAFIKCYKVAERFNIVGSYRNDDRFRYWCHFKMNDDDNTFNRIVLRGWYKETQEDYAKKNATIKNVLYLLTFWDEYMDLNFDEMANLDSYTKNQVNSTVSDKLKNALRYLQKLHYFFDQMYSELEVVDGRLRRINKVFPTELYTPLLANVESMLVKLTKLSDKLEYVSKAHCTLDRSTFNFSVLDNAVYTMKYVHDVWEQVAYTASVININTRKHIKNSDERTPSVYRDMKEKYEKCKLKASERQMMKYGYSCYGPRYSRLPNNGKDARMRIFI